MTRTWTAAMIAPDPGVEGAPRLRGEVELDAAHGPVESAALHVTALGVVEAWVNGRRAGDDVLTPGFSSYEWRLRYRTYDVTALVAPTTVIGLTLGNGWYRGRLGWFGNGAFYGPELAGLAELEVTFGDGHVQRFGTDGSWRAGPSDVLADDLYDGQTVDARRRDGGAWLRPGPLPEAWVGVHEIAFDRGRLTPYTGPVVRRQEVLRPVRVWTSDAGRRLVDFGQNLVGWVRFSTRGEPGGTITLRHAEVLEHGEPCLRTLRTARATDRFVLSGGDDAFEPTLTFHGFRYVDVEGWPGELTERDLEAVVVHSDLRRTGYFGCSDPLLDQLHRNIVWSLRGNAVDIPTDCPQRDERLGWTGDLAVFGPSAVYLYDMAAFLDDWLADLACETAAADGRVPYVVPDVLKYEHQPDWFPPEEPTALWSDAAVWVPWALWQAYGDAAALARHYPAMAAHVRRVERNLSPSGLWDTGFHLGDWLDPKAPPDDPGRARADVGVLATACYLRTLDLAGRAATVLGHDGDAAAFAATRARVLAAFREHYVAPDGVITSDCPTVYALAIAFGLLDGASRQQAGDHLARHLTAGGHRMDTGFAGTPFVLDALADTGHLDVAYRLLLQRECPSWLYPVTMGATTVWERWDSLLPDGTVNPGGMTSFNHYALGAVADWLHRTVGGIAPLEPGYRRVLVAPRPGGGLISAHARLETPHGAVTTRWSVQDGRLDLTLEVPHGVTAEVRFPGVDEVELAAGTHHLGGPTG